jgi:subtilisin-like proprotein convertase family protein
MVGRQARTRNFGICATVGVVTALLLAVIAPAAEAVAPVLPSCTPTTTTFDAPDPLAIPDAGAQVASGVTVSGAGSYVSHVEVTTNFAHTFPADLDVVLESPDGRVVELTTDNAGSNDNAFNGTRWDDGSPAVTDFVYAINVPVATLAPEQSLSNFEGGQANGLWQLKVTDDLAGDVGTLNGWSLHLTTQPAPPTVSPTTIVNSTDPATAIPDVNPAGLSESINVSGLQNGIQDINLFTDITHTFPADLDVTLTSPSGRVVTITTDNGGSNDDSFHGTLWDDQTALHVTSATYAVGVVQPNLSPEQPLAGFQGEDPNGTWTLKVADDLASDVGNLQSWGLQIVTGTCAQPKDTRAPALKFSKSAQKLLKQKALLVKAVSDENGTVAASATISIKGVKKSIKLKAVTKSAVAGVTQTLKLKLSKKNLKAIKKALKAHRTVKASVTATAIDAAGNTTPLKQTIKGKK